MLSNYLAELWGLSMVILLISFLVREKHMKKLFSSIENSESLFTWGLMSLVVGLATVLAHNIWVKNWQVIVTILGWIALIKGVCLLFAPEYMKRCTKKFENSPALPYALIIGVFVGLVITYFGFTG